MKFGIIFLAALLIGCTGNATTVQNTSNSTSGPQRSEKLESMVSHTTENQSGPVPAPNSGPNTKWTQSGNPIDTAKFDGVIIAAEKMLRSNPANGAAKTTAAQAYFDRGFALTEAHQYAAALGDFRKALKLDPDQEDAKKWIDKIINIYASIKRDFPKEGEEPPPLPFKKG